MRSPVLADLHQQDATDPVIAAPVYPEGWQQPALASLLTIASDWPIDVMTLPYAGCAMLSWTRTQNRTCLIRVTPGADYLRADITQCRPNAYPATGVDLGFDTLITGDTDGTVIRINLPAGTLGDNCWPFSNTVTQQARGTLSAATPAAPAAYINRQIDITATKAPQTEPIVTQRHNAITFWTGAQVGDLSTL